MTSGMFSSHLDSYAHPQLASAHNNDVKFQRAFQHYLKQLVIYDANNKILQKRSQTVMGKYIDNYNTNTRTTKPTFVHL